MGFAAAQEKAQRRSDASIPRGTAKPSTAGGESFTSVVGSRKELEKVADLGPNSKRVVFSDASRVHSNPLHMTLHTSDGEATSAQLARTVSAIHEGMLRKNDLQGKVVKKVQPEGKPRISASEWARGARLSNTSVFSDR